MIERIKELAIKSGFKKYDGDGLYSPYIDGEELNEELQEFAELIIKECLDACSRVNEIRNIVPPTQEQVCLWCMYEIEKHFGVE